MKKLIAIFFVGLLLFGADYGRITGRVIDSETNEPLIGADVIVENTELGAATDENGEYTVLYVPAGTYKVVSSYISFDPYTFTNVVVNADQTTLLNFRLRPTVIEVQGITAVAERPMVVISQTQTGRAVTSQEMARLPVTTINQVITLQAGVAQDMLGTHLRGGRIDEILYFVDGIATKNANFGLQSSFVAPSAVEEVTMVSGGFDAEYGDALSGVVNIITKEGGAKHSGNIRWLTDEMFSGMRKLDFGYNLYDFTLGGPLPFTPRLRYFLSGELWLTDSYHEALYFIPAPRQEYRAQARLAYHFPNAKGKVTVSAHNERRQYVLWGVGTRTNRYRIKYFDQRPMQRWKNSIFSGTFNYMATEKTLFSVKLGMTQNERFYGNRDYAWEAENDRQWYEDYRAFAEHLFPLLLNEDDRLEAGLTLRDVLVDSLLEYHEDYTNLGEEAIRNSPYAREGYFMTAGDYRLWQYIHNSDYQGRLDVTHSIGRVHEFKSGLDVTQYNIEYFLNTLPFDANPFWDYYNKKPMKIGYYFQDKMDFQGLIARLGFRIDYFHAKALTFETPEDFLDNTLIESDPTFKISPRIGFSLPVTDRMKLRFNYGHYYQFPNFDDMYTTNDTGLIRLAIVRGNQNVGNVILEAQKTVMYELGIENQFSDDIAVGFTAYFKDIYDLTQLREVPAIPTAYFKYFNVDYGNVKGFELSLQKRMSNMWALGLNYTLQFAKGTASNAQEWYQDYYFYQISVPVIDYWLDFDERHTINANVDFELPKDFFFVPLQEFISSFVFSYHTGQPYTPEDLDGNRTGDENSARMPGWWNVDVNFSRRVSFGPLKVTFSGLIENLFNTEQVTNVYPTTGDPMNHGDPEPRLSQFSSLSILSSRYSPQGDFNHDGLMTREERKEDYMLAISDYYRDPRNYFNGFRMRFGVGIGF
ncbi:MAG: TonB-dependent receptor [candidate division WOR-3 bacterium]|nr:MAG: TonB-dependent receptor [candidate division WOR-3 bacterium]